MAPPYTRVMPRTWPDWTTSSRSNQSDWAGSPARPPWVLGFVSSGESVETWHGETKLDEPSRDFRRGPAEPVGGGQRFGPRNRMYGFVPVAKTLDESGVDPSMNASWALSVNVGTAQPRSARRCATRPGVQRR